MTATPAEPAEPTLPLHPDHVDPEAPGSQETFDRFFQAIAARPELADMSVERDDVYPDGDFARIVDRDGDVLVAQVREDGSIYIGSAKKGAQRVTNLVRVEPSWARAFAAWITSRLGPYRAPFTD